MPAIFFAALVAAFSALGFLALFPGPVIIHEAIDIVNLFRDPRIASIGFRDRRIVSIGYRDRRSVRIVRDRRWPTPTRMYDLIGSVSRPSMYSATVDCLSDTRTLRIGPFDNRGATIGGGEVDGEGLPIS